MKYTFSSHAIQRMFGRNIKKDDVIKVIQTGETIKEYKDDKPLQSRLVLGFVEERAIHVLFALDNGQNQCIIITVYEPSTEIWQSNFKERG
jgi:hypothetical protein